MFRQIEVSLSPKARVNLSGDGSPPTLSGPIILPLPPRRLPPASGGRSGAVGGHFPAIRLENGRGGSESGGKRKTGVGVWIIGRSGEGVWLIKWTEEMENFRVGKEDKEEDDDDYGFIVFVL